MTQSRVSTVKPLLLRLNYSEQLTGFCQPQQDSQEAEIFPAGDDFQHSDMTLS
jgi:hypothetical protein